VALFVISASTKGETEENVAVAVNELAMEEEQDTGEKVEDLEKPTGEKLSPEEMHVFPITKGIIVFQVLLIFASIYYCMLLTNWGNPIVNGENSLFFGQTSAAYWIKMVSVWISILIYTFSMVAPLILRNREFS